MADIRFESFLSVEKSMSRVLLVPWARDVGQPIAQRIVSLVRQERFAEADEVARELNFDAVPEKLGQLDLLANAAFILGESFFAGGQAQGQVGSGSEPAPQELEVETQALAQTLQSQGAERVRQAARDAITMEEGLVLGTIDPTDVLKVEEIQKAVVPGMAARINQSVMGTGAQVVNVEANLTTSRLVSYGALNEADANGVGKYQITEILDNKICPVCIRMHGKVFDVPTAKQQVLATLLTDPHQIPAGNPSPRSSRAGVEELTSLSDDELVGKGWNRPPFHPMCRGILVPVGTVPRSQTVPFTPLLVSEPISAQMRTAVKRRAARAARGEIDEGTE